MESYDVEDFELRPPIYRTIVQVFNEEGQVFGDQVCADHEDPEIAIAFAKSKATELANLMNTCVYMWEGTEPSGAEVSVETVIQVEGEEQYSGTLFTDIIYQKGK